MREREHRLAQTARLATGGRLEPTPSAAAEPPRRTRAHRLASGGAGLGQHLRYKGGEATGPNPTDRGWLGTKHHLLVHRNDIPLAALVSPANWHDSRTLEPLLDAIQPIKGLWGRPRKRPEKLHGDKGYDFDRCRDACRRGGITPRIARRSIESSETLGRYRWVVERTLAWLARYRRLTIRYERLAELHRALLTLACGLVCWTALNRRTGPEQAARRAAGAC